MSAAEELDLLDAEWDRLAPDSAERARAASDTDDPPRRELASGIFGHSGTRRLGLRVPAACWALLKDGERGVYARAVELSPTGVVLKFFDGETRFERAQKFELDLFVPGATRPVHATALPARAIGKLEAFEFLLMSSPDRLTLAEHLDHLGSRRAFESAPQAEPRSATPPVSWKDFVQSLKQNRAARRGFEAT